MRLTSGRLPGLLAKLDAVSVVAVHGEAEPPVRDVARAVVRAELDQAEDSLRLVAVAECDEAGLDILVRSQPLGGGRPVVWVSEASERLARVVEQVLADPSLALLVLGFGGRFGQSRLAGSIAASEHGCVVDCAQDGAGAEALLASVLRPLDVRVATEAAFALADWAASSGQSLPVAGMAAGLLVGAGGQVTVEDVARIAGERGGDTLVRAVSAGLAGDRAALDRAVATTLEDGQAGIGLVRRALAAIRYGRPGSGQVVLDEAADALWRAERTAKQTGYPQELLSVAAVRSLGRPRAP